MIKSLSAALLCLGLCVSDPVWAAPSAKPDAQKWATDPSLARNVPLLRKSCYLKAAPIWEDGATGPVIQANQAYRDCLLDLSEKVLIQYYNTDLLKPLKPRQFLEKHLESVSALAYTVQTNVKACLPHCGTMWQMMASGQEGIVLEKLLRDMAERILLETDESLLSDQAKWKTCWETPTSCPAKF
ncbi:MAG: hypothetical protein AB7I41_25080 [Candidatus Sericytochromatia bacterium]